MTRSSGDWGPRMHLIRALTSKITMSEVAKSHLETLTTERDTAEGTVVEYSYGDFVVFFILPAALGTGLALAGVKAPKPDPLLSAIAILTGLLFALIVMVFDQVKRTADVPPPASGNDPLVDAWQLLANVSWAILASVLLLTVMFGTVVFTEGTLAPWLTGVVTGLFAHLILTLLMVLKRVVNMARRIVGVLQGGRR
jgi:hypothetical protein